jgi:hypothetical protein
MSNESSISHKFSALTVPLRLENLAGWSPRDQSRYSMTVSSRMQPYPVPSVEYILEYTELGSARLTQLSRRHLGTSHAYRANVYLADAVHTGCR